MTYRSQEMNRRDFTFLALATVVVPETAFSQSTFRQVRAFESRMSGETFAYSRKQIKDPTGSAPSKKVERFEVRGSDCRRSHECVNPRPLNGRMVARNRSERVLGYRLGEGAAGIFRYSVYLPSGEYTIVDSVGSTFGQLLWAFGRGDEYDSFPIFSLDTAYGMRGRVEVVHGEMRETEGASYRTSQHGVGSLYDGLMDQWLNIEVQFKLSSGRDGHLITSINGRKIGSFKGRTALTDGWLEVRYGVYQTGTNQFSGNPSDMPTQVAYFSNVQMLASS